MGEITNVCGKCALEVAKNRAEAGLEKNGLEKMGKLKVSLEEAH